MTAESEEGAVNARRNKAKQARRQARDERLASALRDNLARRKAQRRGRDEAAPDDGEDGVT